MLYLFCPSKSYPPEGFASRKSTCRESCYSRSLVFPRDARGGYALADVSEHDPCSTGSCVFIGWRVGRGRKAFVTQSVFCVRQRLTFPYNGQAAGEATEPPKTRGGQLL